MSTTTSELVVAAKAGDAAAFSELVRRERDRLVMAARALVRDLQDAEDVAQEALVAAHAHLLALEDPAKFRPWSMRILTRLAIRRRKRPRLALLGENTDRVAARPPVRHPRIEALVRAVRELPEKYRLPVTLFYLAGLDYRGTAESLGWTEKLVKSRLHRARERLRRRMEREDRE